MGGPGSGERWDRSARNLTDLCLQIDVRRLQREGLLTPARVFGWKWTAGPETVGAIEVRVGGDQIHLVYRHRDGDGDEWQATNYPVRLEWTPCHFGGSRPWFLCPAAGCGRRVAILYCGPIFACRHCHRLVYRCQRESPYDRAARRADKICGRLGWLPGLCNAKGGKKKGMHWRTFKRLTSRYDASAADAAEGLMQVVRRLSKQSTQKLQRAGTPVW